MIISARRLLFTFFYATTSFFLYGADHSQIFYLLGEASYTELSFRMERDLIIVPLSINDSENMNFILDTGTESPVILNRKYIQNLGLPLGRHVDFQGAGKKKTTSGQVINSMRMQIANAYTNHIGGVVLYDNTLSNLRINGIQIHGIIGASLFRSFAVEIDYPNSTLRLYEDKSFLNNRNFSVQNLTVSRDRPILRSELKNRGRQYDINLMIDTGLSYELLIYDQALFNYSRLPTDKIGKGYSGNIVASTVHVEKLEFAGLQFSDVRMILPTTNTYRTNYNFIRDRDGTIGNKLLMGYCIVLDYAKSFFYIERPTVIPKHPTFVADEKI